MKRDRPPISLDGNAHEDLALGDLCSKDGQRRLGGRGKEARHHRPLLPLEHLTLGQAPRASTKLTPDSLVVDVSTHQRHLALCAASLTRENAALVAEEHHDLGRVGPLDLKALCGSIRWPNVLDGANLHELALQTDNTRGGIHQPARYAQ